MADNLNISLIIRAINKASAPLRQVAKDINAVSERTAYLRQAAGTLARIGVASVGAGAAIGYGLKSAVAGYDELQNHIDRLATATGGLTNIQRASIEKFVKAQAVISGFDTSSLTESLYQGVSGFLSMQQAMAVTAQAAKIARATSGDVADVTRTLSTAMLNFSNPAMSAAQNAQTLGDKLTAIQTGAKWTNITDLTYALSIGAPIAKAYGITLDQTLGAMSAFSASGETGERGGSAFLETITQLGKGLPKLGLSFRQNAQGGVDLAATLQQLSAATRGLSATQIGVMFEKDFGARAGPKLVQLLDHFKEFQQATSMSANSLGATDKAFSQFGDKGTLAFSQLSQAISNIGLAIGGALAPAVSSAAKYLTAIAVDIQKFAEVHTRVIKYIAAFAAISAAVLVVGGGLALATSAVLGFASVVPVLGVFAGLIGSISGLTGIWTAAQWALNAALDANPLGIMIVSAAALGFAIVEVIKHWQAIKDFMLALPAVALDAGKRILDALIKPFLDLPQHIRNAGADIKNAVEGIAGSIGRFFIGHSPIPEGPLHDLNLGRDIGRTLRPSPILTALRTTAAAVAIAAPMALAPAMAGAAVGPAMSGASVSHAPVYNITVNAPSGDAKDISNAVIAAIKRHDSEVAKILAQHSERRRRLEY